MCVRYLLLLSRCLSNGGGLLQRPYPISDHMFGRGGVRHPQGGGRKARSPRYPRNEPRPPRGKRRVRRRLLGRRRKGPLRRPWALLFSLLSFLFFKSLVYFLFLALGGSWGAGAQGYLTITAQAGSRSEKGSL